PDGRMVSVITGTGTLVVELTVFDLERRQALPHAIKLRASPPGALAMGRSRWTPDGKAVMFVTQDPQGRYVLVRCPLEYWRTGEARSDTLFDASNESVESFGISPDGRKLVASVLEYLSGLTVAEGIKGIVPPRASGAGSR